MKNINLVDKTNHHSNTEHRNSESANLELASLKQAAAPKQSHDSESITSSINPMTKAAVPTAPVNPDKLINTNSNDNETVISFEEYVAQKQASIAHYPQAKLNQQQGVRFINSKFPTINLFDDVAEPEEFEALYAIQSITNLRCKNDNGTLTNLPKDKVPKDIVGSHYACAPFTHINPDGSRFSGGSFGVLYLADCAQTAMAEVCFHQLKQWQNIEGLHFDSVVLRQLDVTFSADLVDITQDTSSPLYDGENYAAAQALGFTVHHLGQEGIQFESVRRKGHTCWALMSPKRIEKIEQSNHFELIFDGKKISHVRLISNFEH